jgi:hypothetical protein
MFASLLVCVKNGRDGYIKSRTEERSEIRQKLEISNTKKGSTPNLSRHNCRRSRSKKRSKCFSTINISGTFDFEPEMEIFILFAAAARRDFNLQASRLTRRTIEDSQNYPRHNPMTNKRPKNS